MEIRTILNLTKDQEDRATLLHRDSIVISSLDALSKKSHDDITGYFRKCKEGGITAQNITVANGGATQFRPTVETLCMWYRILRENSDLALEVRSLEDIYTAKKEGKAGVIFGFQGTSPIEHELDFLQIFYRLGVRIIGLTYQRGNLVGDGCEERRDCGLRKFGVQVVEEMNRLGILIDLSHVGRRTAMEAIELSKDPIILSHTNVYSLCAHIRNQTDEVIKAMAEKGGVIGIVPMSQFLRPEGAMEGSTISDYLDHVDYVAKLVGVDYVGVGLDLFEGETTEEAEHFDKMFDLFKRPYLLEKKHSKMLESVSEFPNVTKGLIARGYSDQDIKKVIGGNFLRVFKKVWK